MTREEVLKNYEVENGIIKSPGKFEGEPIYVPYFYSLMLEGASENFDYFPDGSTQDTFTIIEEDIIAFPELKGAKEVIIIEDTAEGFIYSRLN